MKVYIQLVTSKSLICKAISWMTWSDWDHVDFVVDGQLFGASIGGVKMRDYNYSNFTRKLILSVDVTDEQRTQLDAFLTSQWGKPYDYAALFAFLVRRNWAEDNKWFCSELCAAAFAHIGLPILRTESLNRITPRDVSISPIFTKVFEGPYKEEVSCIQS